MKNRVLFLSVVLVGGSVGLLIFALYWRDYLYVYYGAMPVMVAGVMLLVRARKKKGKEGGGMDFDKEVIEVLILGEFEPRDRTSYELAVAILTLAGEAVTPENIASVYEGWRESE